MSKQRKKELALIQQELFTMPESLVLRPCLNIGGSGSGKTVTSLRVAYLAAKACGYDIIFLDAKGDNKLIPQFVAIMRQAGKTRIRVFPTTPYYGWVGDKRALHNRLMAIQSFSEAYYENMANMMLDLAISAPGGPPRSSADLLKNLTLERLRLLYRGLPEQEELARIKPEDANGVYNRYRAFFRALNSKLDDGFTFDETDAAFIKLDTIAFAKEASSLGRFLVEDLAHYITVRKPEDKKVLIIIDEVSALAIENIANLAERLRSFGGVVMLACQSEEGLAKTQDERNRILKASHMLLLHNCNTPEKLIERAGKHKQINAGWSIRDQEGTGYGTLHMSDEYIIPPDEARRLEVGECFVIVNGAAYKVHVKPVEVDATGLNNAKAYIEQEAQRSAAAQAPTQAVPAVSIMDDAHQTNHQTQEDDDDRQQNGNDDPDLL